MSTYKFGKATVLPKRTNEYRGLIIVYPYNDSRHEISVRITERLLYVWKIEQRMNINDIEAISIFVFHFIIGFIKSKSKPRKLGFKYDQDDILKDVDTFELNIDNFEQYYVEFDNVDKIEGTIIKL